MKEHAHKHYHASMLGVEEALSRILAPFRTLEIEDKSLLNSLGQVLAEDILSNINVPPWPNSAMDGYALQFNSIEKATSESPIFLKVIGNAAAGYMPKERVVPGTAIRIMTGAPIPQGADTVIPFEDTDEEQRKTDGDSLKEIGIKITAPKGACIRAAAEDISIGETVLKKGQTLRSGEIGVIASLGLKTVKVIRLSLIHI